MNAVESAPAAPPIPRTFGEYVRSFGPGFVVVLTWLGAGDVVDASVAGGKYGYALMWVMVLAIAMRFVVVSAITRYQLCNPRGEGVLDGLWRIHRGYALFLTIAAVVMAHLYGSYMTRGVGEVWANISSLGLPKHWAVFLWAVVWTLISLALVFRPVYRLVERVFFVLLALLSIAFLGSAIWVGPDVPNILRGMYSVRLPQEEHAFNNALLLALALMGAVGGSLMNLVYPYFIEQKGWRGPEYRRVQLYDFTLSMLVMVVLNLAIWVLGAEVLHGSGANFDDLKLEDIAGLLGNVLGRGGEVLFYLGVFAAVFTSIIGHAMGLGCLTSHGWLTWQRGPGVPQAEYREHPIYRWVVLWCLVSPLVWALPGMPGFVILTITVNAAQVVLVPPIAVGLWMLTAKSRWIGERHRNRAWENVVMAVVLLLAVCFAVSCVVKVAKGLGAFA